MEIFFVLLGLSIPIFYLWGIFAFFQTFFGKKETNQVEQVNEKTTDFVKYFYQRVEANPDLSLQEFLDEVRDQRRRAILETDSEADVDESVSDAVFDIDEEEQAARLGDLVSSPVQAQSQSTSGFSWREWYADHSIDFILYLGAFVIVAAVSLFVGFQWETFDSITRFGIVVAFTVAWYIAGFAVQRFLALDSVTIAFLTIGAILTPFCGVAWQRFVIGSMENVGITWLLTAIIGTVIYLTLSLVYQRRHFTYFGNLSILASILAIVEVSDAADEYFILAASVTATILLIGRIAVKTLAPRLDAYLGQDVEWSSLVILIFAVIAGLLLLPLIALPLYSIQVLVVMISVLVYLGIYLTLHFNIYTVILVQVMSVLTLSHALITFEVDSNLSLYIVFIAHLVSQFIINRWLEERHPQIFAPMNISALLISLVTYAVAALISDGGFLAIPAGLLLMGHAVYYANRFEQHVVWYGVAVLCYAVLTHILQWLGIDEWYWISAYIVLGAAQLAFILTEQKREIIEAFVHVGTLALGLLGFVSIIALASPEAIDSLDGFALMLMRINPFVVLALYGLLMLFDNARVDAILKPYLVIVLAASSIVYYVSSLQAAPVFMSILLALSVMPLFWVAYRVTHNERLFFIIYAAPYFALFHVLFELDVALEVYPIAYAILAGAMYFALFLPEESDLASQVVPILALAIVSILSYLTAVEEAMTMHFAGWIASYTVLLMLWLSRKLLGDNIGDVVFTIAVLLQYYWHIVFLEIYVSSEIFGNIQWYTAAAASLLIWASLEVAQRQNTNSDLTVRGLELLGVATLMLPTLIQILELQSLLFFGLGVVYSLIIGAVGITFKNSRHRNYAAIALVLVVLFQSREFLLNLPRWLVVGVIGFGLVGAGLYLSIRRRGTKKPAPIIHEGD